MSVKQRGSSDALYGASVGRGKDGRGQVGPPHPLQEVRVPLCPLG